MTDDKGTSDPFSSPSPPLLSPSSPSSSSSSSSPTSSITDKINEKILEYANPQSIESMRESCIFAIVSHGAMGFLFGGALGLFLSGMASTGPEANLLNPNATPIVGFKAQARQIFRDMMGRTWSSAKNFGKIAALFTGFECVTETFRAKHDIYNTLAAGCATGAVLGIKSGPKSALFGCAGFAAFSAAIEHFLQDRINED